MDSISALAKLTALAQETRLEVFRLLVRAEPQGLWAGEIVERLKVRQNTLSSHLGVLARAGLIRAERNGRNIRYFADLEGMQALLAFLMEDCCGGSPKACRPLLASVLCGGSAGRESYLG